MSGTCSAGSHAVQSGLCSCSNSRRRAQLPYLARALNAPDCVVLQLPATFCNPYLCLCLHLCT
jgi:hypothetical protein